VLAGCGGGASTTTATQSATATNASTTTAASSTTAGASASQDKPVTLTAVSFLPKTHPLCSTIPKFVELVKQKTNGTVTIDYKGGPEVIAAVDQFEAVRTGAVDLLFTSGTYYEKQNLAQKGMYLTKVKPWEERTAGGLFDYMVDLHAKLGVQYIGRWHANLPFYFFLNKPISSVSELKGMKLRSTANYELFFKALGINGVTVDAAEVYTALERNIVEGFAFVLLGPRSSGWTQITKYYIDVPWWEGGNAAVLMNPKDWSDKLSENQRKQITEAQIEYEKYVYTTLTDMQTAEKAELEKSGVKTIDLPEDQKKQLRDMAYKSMIDGLQAAVPDELAKLKKITGWE